jgi:hypothetical protein
MKSKIGTSKNPPATPISVPKAPINRPITASKNQIMFVYTPFPLKIYTTKNQNCPTFPEMLRYVQYDSASVFNAVSL